MLEVAAAWTIPGAACEPLLQRAQQLGPGLGPVVGVARDVEPKGQERFLHEARGGFLQAQEAADHEVGAREQGEAERDLTHHQRRLQALVARPRGGARAVAELARRRSGREERKAGSRPDTSAATSGDARGEGHDPPVEVGLHPVGKLLRPGGHHELAPPGAEHQAERPPQGAEHHGLAQHLAHQARPARPQGGAHRQLALTSDPSSQDQVGEVGAADEQHRRHRSQQGHGDDAHAAIHHRVAERHRADAPAAVGVGMLLGQAGGDEVELALGLLQGGPRSEEAEAGDVALRPVGPSLPDRRSDDTAPTARRAAGSGFPPA